MKNMEKSDEKNRTTWEGRSCISLTYNLEAILFTLGIEIKMEQPWGPLELIRYCNI